ncbi:hypothetical protein AGMMS50289_23750 [Betaproteobacteria bacterium]|nr:hypothetical protein AGMMS50289_23750 [Betaproteobacteria bacterium]
MKIRDSDEIYAYLKDANLRIKKIGKQRITIKNFDFSSEKFGGSWGYFDFVDCDFTSTWDIRLDWLNNCTFTNCHFSGIFDMGGAKKVLFSRCKVDGNPSGLIFDSQTDGLVFENCEFINPDSDPNHPDAINCEGKILLRNCKARYFSLDGHKALSLKGCTIVGSQLGSASPATFSDKSKMPYSDFLIEDCDLRGGAEISNAQLQSFILRNSKVGILKTWRSTIRDAVLVEDIHEGFISLASTTITNSLTVRNCSFYAQREGHSFKCNIDTPARSVIENIKCGSAPVDVICSGGAMKESDWLPVASNKFALIKNSKIPHLRADWAQTEHLRIENCELGEVYIRDGRIGKLEIIGCSLMKLDVSRTQVKEQDVRIREGGKISGHVTVTEGSNIKLTPR